MSVTTNSTVIGIFPSRQDADAAISALYDAGFTSNEIGVVSKNSSGASTSTTKATEEAEDAGQGAAVGAAAGAGLGALVGAGVLAGIVPVIGPALFGGTLGVLASNAAGGAAVAGVIGALTGWGGSDEDAQYYEGEVVSGRTIVTVNASDRSDEARSIMRRFGATSRDPQFASTPMQG